MPSGTPAHHLHATPKPIVAERAHGHKEGHPQVTPVTNVLPGDSPFVMWDQFQSAMSVIRTVIRGTGESDATFPILPENCSTVQAFLMRIERRYTQMGLEPREWGSALIDHLVGPALTVADIRYVSAPAKGNVPDVRGKYARNVAVWDTMLATVLLMNEWGNQLLNTAEGTDTSNGHAEGTQPLSEAQRESESASILSEEAPGATTASSRKSAEATEDGYRPYATEIAPHWWRETCMKEPYDQGGALCYAGATAVLRVELAGSPSDALLDNGDSRSFISTKTVE
ncbi:hypothetical protein ENH_00019370 [Eimeria necatrix]|uniref:Uncharacterized protein n=1 Tax=Eimeria necatrix TaxID=51315 RepID=U6MQR7_9EIME|nr:hypothetical protein ENH_00019370 [Eimeria necatrix]CDJ66366.1 hypothetical protein ENH_00019370 [Eimeria necatrix]